MTSPTQTEPHEIATLAGGCFWCLEPVFRALAGVQDVQCGYIGGHGPADYRSVCGGDTGHAEAVQIRFDPQQIAFADLLHVFFTLHDPTTRNRQGNDVGTQYRSAVFFHSAAQQEAARAAIARASADWGKPATTALIETSRFWPAEEDHQRYFERNPTQGYCLAIIPPKLAKLRAHFGRLLA